MSISFVKIEIVIAFLDKTFQSSYNFLKLYCRRYRTMGVELAIADSSVLTTEEQADLSKRIDALIAAHKNNRQEINRLVFESVSAMTTGEDYERQLSNKRGLRRFFGSITGSNKRLQDKINSSRAAAQYTAQCTLQKLAEENLMTFDLITAVNNKLNASVTAVEGELNQVYNVITAVNNKLDASMTAVEGELNQVYNALLAFFKQSRSDVLQLGQRVDRLEQNVNLLNWQNSIEYQMFNGVEYMDLDDTAKIICLVRDFYDITQGQWTTMDLLLLKSAMGTIGISPREKIDYYHFIQTVSSNAQLRSKLLGEKQLYGVPENYLVPLLSMKKLALLDNEEAFIVGTVEESLTDAGVPTDRQSIEGKLLTKYMAQEAHVDLTTQIPHYDLILELLFNLQNAENYGILRTQEEIKALEEAPDLTETAEQEAVEAPLDPEGAEEVDTPVDEAPAQANPYLKIPELCERVRDEENLSGSLWNALHCRRNGQFDQEFVCYQEIIGKAYNNADKGAAYNNLAYMYDNGDYVSADPYKAFEYYRMAAELENNFGKFNLGICYLTGLGTEPNVEQGKNWLTDVNHHAHWSHIVEQADYILCYCFNRREEMGLTFSFSFSIGLSIDECNELTRYWKDKNYIDEIHFYEKIIQDSTSSSSRKAFSYNNMGYLYENGLGVPQDHAKAFGYYYEAAKLESSTGKCNLGFCYLNGIGVNRDKKMAKYWLENISCCDGDRSVLLMWYC